MRGIFMIYGIRLVKEMVLEGLNEVLVGMSGKETGRSPRNG